MAQSTSTRQSRKRRRARPKHGAVTGAYGQSRAPSGASSDGRRQQSMLGAYGERPASPFGGLPVSEIAIFIGGFGAVIGFASHATAPLIVGLVVCALGVLEFTVREHFSGYRSHSTLLAAVPAVAILALSVALLGAPRQRTARELMLLTIVPVFAVSFWALRKRFRAARQARLVRRPSR